MAVLAATAGTATAASDLGWFDGKSAEEREAIVNYVYERTGHAPPHTGGAAEGLSNEMAQSMIDAGEDDAPLAPDGGALELVVGTKVGLLSRVGTMMPTMWAVGGTFVAGLAIGTGVRKLFATLTGPEDARTGGSPNWTWGSISWRPQGTDLWAGATVQQAPGAYLFNNGSHAVIWDEPPCSYSGFTPPAGARMQYAVPSNGQCNVWIRDVGWRLFPTYVDYPYLLDTDVRPVAPLRPFDPLTDTPLRTIDTPPDPGARAVEDDLDVLDEDGNDLLRDQIDWALTPGAQTEEEPVRVGTRLSEEDRACKDHFGDAPQSDPGSRSSEADPEVAGWDYDVDDFSGVYNPLTSSTQTVKLRWGTRAWGYRHIVLRHGWDVAAATRTALALTDPAPTVERNPGSFRYVAELTGGPSNVTCRQRVIVSYRQDSTVPPGRHIITSFVDGEE